MQVQSVTATQTCSVIVWTCIFLTSFLCSAGVSSNRRWPWALCFLIRWAGLLNLGISDKGKKGTRKTETDRNNEKLLISPTSGRCVLVHRYLISLWVHELQMQETRLQDITTQVIILQKKIFRHISLSIEKCSKQVTGIYGVEVGASLHVRTGCWDGYLDPRRRKQQEGREDATAKNSQFVIFST